MIKNNPPKTMAPLNKIEVIPVCTPRSLNALFVQLNWFHEATDKNIHTRTNTGATKPVLPTIFSNLSFKQIYPIIYVFILSPIKAYLFIARIDAMFRFLPSILIKPKNRA
jgi:hypothetical protein